MTLPDPAEGRERAIAMSATTDMVCEQHPDTLWPHRGALGVCCPGPGMPHSWITQLRERVAALEGALVAIIYASDQCVGHRDCGHSMEPWTTARELLALTPGRASSVRKEE